MFSTAGMTRDALHAMWQACRAVSLEPDITRACQQLALRLSAILGAPALVYRREVSAWKPLSSPSAAPGPGEPLPPDPDALSPEPATAYPAVTGPRDTRWTPVPLETGTPHESILLLPGDWHVGAVADWLPRLAVTASMAIRLVASREAAGRKAVLTGVAYGFTRNLGHVTGHRLLYRYIVAAAARAANARLVSLSIYDPKEGTIAVAATHGYPADAVESVRIAPGSGIVGGVFSSRKPLLVRDAARVPGLSSRSTRYQTPSFMALPIVSGRDAIGVLTLADRADGAPFTRDDLGAMRLIAALAAVALVREQLTTLSRELANAAAIDPVTGLFNRRYFHTRLEAELERSRRDGMPIAIVMLDVDGFKAVNDRLGHPAGDVVLRNVAEIIRTSVRASDVCTRFGGDEFAIIVPEHAVTAAHTAGRIRQRVERFRWDSLGLPQPVQVTVSAGVGIAEIGEGAESLLSRADRHLYQAKAGGRNRVYPEDL